MGVTPRPAAMEAQLAALDVLLDEARVDEAGPLLEEIRRDLGEDDPTVQTLTWRVKLLDAEDADDP